MHRKKKDLRDARGEIASMQKGQKGTLQRETWISEDGN
jgi:hypothetical protein